jgi:hypothetical protein
VITDTIGPAEIEKTVFKAGYFLKRYNNLKETQV